MKKGKYMKNKYGEKYIIIWIRSLKNYRKRQKKVRSDMDVFRRIMSISKRDTIKNEEIRIQVGIKDIIRKDIEGKFVWWERVLRMNRFPTGPNLATYRKKEKRKT